MKLVTILTFSQADEKPCVDWCAERCRKEWGAVDGHCDTPNGGCRCIPYYPWCVSLWTDRCARNFQFFYVMIHDNPDIDRLQLDILSVHLNNRIKFKRIHQFLKCYMEKGEEQKSLKSSAFECFFRLNETLPSSSAHVHSHYYLLKKTLSSSNLSPRMLLLPFIKKFDWHSRFYPTEVFLTSSPSEVFTVLH